MATAWRVANSLQTLLGQLNAIAPSRSKLSDGAIGDVDHASRSSDHNPWYVLLTQPLVTARDFTHDPKGGLDCQRLADALVASGDKRIKYVIWNERIWQAGSWKPYTGPNPHTKHLHLSVVASPLADSNAAWNLPGLTGPTPTTPAPAPAQEVPHMDQRQDALLTGCYQQFSGSSVLGEWTGWPSFDGGSGYSLTLVDYARQADVQLNDIRRDIADLKSSGNAPGSLSDNDVSRIAVAVLDELSRRAAA